MMLKMCGWCYFCLSVWGIVQLLIMGILYRTESLGLIEDTEAHEFEDAKDYIEKTAANYVAVSNNCFIAAAIYVVILGLAYMCIHIAKKKEIKAKELLLDDEKSCTVVNVPLTQKQLKKIQ